MTRHAHHLHGHGVAGDPDAAQEEHGHARGPARFPDGARAGPVQGSRARQVRAQHPWPECRRPTASSSRRSTGLRRPRPTKSRFRYAPYDQALEAFLRAGNDAERQRAARTMTEILQSYVPVMPLLVDVQNAFVQPWLQGYYPSPFLSYFQYLDIAPSRTPSRRVRYNRCFCEQKQHHARFAVLSLDAEGSPRRSRGRQPAAHAARRA